MSARVDPSPRATVLGLLLSLAGPAAAQAQSELLEPPASPEQLEPLVPVEAGPEKAPPVPPAPPVLAGPVRPEPYIPAGGESTHRLHLKVDAAFTYGIGGQSALGAQVQVTGYTALWNTRRATGSLDVGLQLGYGNEPPWLAPWLAGLDVQGANHRVQLLVSLGHSFHLGARRRAALGVHVLGGWNHWISSFSLRYPGEQVEGSAALSRDHFTAAARLGFSYRAARHVGFHVFAGAPLPTASSYVVGLVNIGLGLSFYAR